MCTHTFKNTYTHTHFHTQPQDAGKETKIERHCFLCTPSSSLSPSPSPSPSLSLAVLFALSLLSPPGTWGACACVGCPPCVCVYVAVCVYKRKHKSLVGLKLTPPPTLPPLVALPPSSLVPPFLSPFPSLSFARNSHQLLGSRLPIDHLQCFLNTKPNRERA